jgi:DNA-binding NarL/FixJ family response regulator
MSIAPTRPDGITSSRLRAEKAEPTWPGRNLPPADECRPGDVRLRSVPTPGVLVLGAATTIVEALAVAIGGQPDLRVVGTAVSEADALQLLDGCPPDVIIQLLHQGSDAIGGIRRLHAAAPRARIVLLAAQLELQLLAQVAAVGVIACLPLNTRLHELIGVIRAAGAGPDHTETTGMMLVGASSFSTALPVQEGATPFGDSTRPPITFPSARPGRTRRPQGLTARELQVLALLGDGYSPQAIASELVISIYTARGHVKSVMHKLGVHSQLEAVATGARMGILQRSGPGSGDAALDGDASDSPATPVGPPGPRPVAGRFYA